MEKWKERYAAFEDYTSGLLIVSGLSLIFFGVIWRYFLNNPQAWIEEVSKYLVVWGALIGTAVALRDGYHIQVDVIHDRVSEKTKKFFNIFSNLLGIFFCIFFIVFGGDVLSMYFKTGQTSTDVGIPLWIVYMVIPVTGLMLGYRFFDDLLKNAKKRVT